VEGTLAVGGNIEMRGQNIAGRDLFLEQHLHLRSAPSLDLFQLPPDVDDFTDRTEVVERIRRQLKHGTTTAIAISAISGRPGVGKTALAVHAAYRVREQFPDGQLYVDLRGAEAQPLDPADVLADFLRALGVASDAIPARIDARVGLYRARLVPRQVLVLLDNACNEAQVRPLLPGSPTCAVLITSRTRLAGLSGGSMVLPVLEQEEAVELLANVAGPDGLDRIVDEREHALTIARSCGCLPLAMRIAGAKLKAINHLQLSELAEQLKDERDRLEELKLGDLEVRAPLEATYRNLLGEEEQRGFRLLSLINAVDFPVWVAAALFGVDRKSATRLLRKLEEVQLLESDETRAAPRYRFHDLIRALAGELLRNEDPEIDQRAAIKRMLDMYLAVAEEASSRYDPARPEQPGDDGTNWSARVLDLTGQLPSSPHIWFEIETIGLVNAVRAAEELEEWDLVLRFSTALNPFLRGSSRWKELELTERSTLRAVRHRVAETMRDLGTALWEQGRWEDALQHLDQSLELFRELQNTRAEMLTRMELGRELREQSRWEPAISHLETAIRGFDELGDRMLAASARRSLAKLYLDQGRLDQSRRHLDSALEVLREAGSLYELSLAGRDLGLNQRADQQFDAAITSLASALDGFERLEDRRYVVVTRFDLATVHFDQGLHDQARREFEAARSEFNTMGDRRWAAIAVTMLGRVAYLQGQNDEARTRLEQALSVFLELGDRRWEARALFHLGHALYASGEHAKAREVWSDALEIFRALRVPEATGAQAALAGAGHRTSPEEGQQRPQPSGQP
jgi:tetratricopeptide (TPR) repeat protein